MKLAKCLYLALATVCCLSSSPSFPFARHGVWNTVNDPNFPVVPVFGCPGLYGKVFPTVPWSNILSQALVAMNEWFVGGGADVRMRYEGDLGDTDSRCVNEAPDTGTILLTAEQNNGSGACFLATTFWDVDSAGNNVNSHVIMHGGTVCNGFFQPWPWATNGDYPGANQFDFQSIFMHELGHALGFDHSSDPNAIMFAFAPQGDSSKRLLSDDDVQGLFQQFPYASTQLNMFDVWSPDDGLSWFENALGSSNVVGSPSSCINNDTSSDTYQGAWTNPFPSQNVTTFTFQSGFVSGQSIGAPSEMSPGIACGSDRVWFGWVNSLTRQVEYIWNVSGQWKGSFAVPFASGVPPAAAEVHDTTGATIAYLLAFADPNTGYLSTVVSTDLVSFPSASMQNYQASDVRTFQGFGLSCMPKAPQCVVTYADGRFHNTPMESVVLSVTPSQSPPVALTSGPTALAGTNGYGGAVAFDNTGGQMAVWRDRGFNTVLASTMTGPINWTSFTLQSAPTLTWANHYNTFATFFSFSSRYNHP